MAKRKNKFKNDQKHLFNGRSPQGQVPFSLHQLSQSPSMRTIAHNQINQVNPEYLKWLSKLSATSNPAPKSTTHIALDIRVTKSFSKPIRLKTRRTNVKGYARFVNIRHEIGLGMWVGEELAFVGSGKVFISHPRNYDPYFCEAGLWNH